MIQAAHATARLEVSLMPTHRLFALLATGALFCAFHAYAQDSQSVADAARQSRQQKQQKDVSAKTTPTASTETQPPKPTKVITNDDLPEHVGSTVKPTASSETQSSADAPSGNGNSKAAAEQWKSQIQAQKAAIASLQAEIASLSESVRYAGANCVANCVQWNERQKEKQDRVEVMKHQLEDQQKHLEDLQESARKQGFGSAVYDP
jgi:hypothetical protein